MYDKITPIPPTGAMTRRKKSVLFLKISSTLPKQTSNQFLLSHKLRVFSRVHSDDFSFSLQPFLNSSQLSSLNAIWLFRMIWALHHLSTFLTCSRTSLKKIPVAADLVIVLAFPAPHPPLPFSRVKYSHISLINCSFHIIVHILPTTALHCHEFVLGLPLLHHLLVVSLLTQINCVGFSTFFNHTLDANCQYVTAFSLQRLSQK